MKWLKLLGEIDGGITMAAAAASGYDASHAKLYMLAAAVAAACGYALNAVAKFYGQDPVVTVSK